MPKGLKFWLLQQRPLKESIKEVVLVTGLLRVNVIRVFARGKY